MLQRGIARAQRAQSAIYTSEGTSREEEGIERCDENADWPARFTTHNSEAVRPALAPTQSSVATRADAEALQTANTRLVGGHLAHGEHERCVRLAAGRRGATGGAGLELGKRRRRQRSVQVRFKAVGFERELTHKSNSSGKAAPPKKRNGKVVGALRSVESGHCRALVLSLTVGSTQEEIHAHSVSASGESCSELDECANGVRGTRRVPLISPREG